MCGDCGLGNWLSEKMVCARELTKVKAGKDTSLLLTDLRARLS